MRKLVLLAFMAMVITVNFSFAAVTKGKTKDVGVLILAHGGKYSSWDEAVKDATEDLRKDYVVEVAFGMANPMSMQAGLDRLEEKGIEKIVVVPLFISSYSPIIRQNEYLLGFRDTLADPPMLMMHHGSGDHEEGDHHESGHHEEMSHHGEMSHDAEDDGEEKKLEQLDFEAEIILTKPLDAHPLVADIIYDRIAELSENPDNETVLIVAHGPNSEEDNKNWVKTIDQLSDQIRKIQKDKGAAFKQIFGLTVRDDANPEIYEQAKEQLRTLVYQSGKNGDVIVIPLLLSQGGVEARYKTRLEGLDYKWSGKTLLPHPNISKFIEVSVEEALHKNP